MRRVRIVIERNVIPDSLCIGSDKNVRVSSLSLDLSKAILARIDINTGIERDIPEASSAVMTRQAVEHGKTGFLGRARVLSHVLQGRPRRPNRRQSLGTVEIPSDARKCRQPSVRTRALDGSAVIEGAHGAGSVFASGAAGYIVIGVLAFALGVAVTLLGVKLRAYWKPEGGDDRDDR